MTTQQLGRRTALLVVLLLLCAAAAGAAWAQRPEGEALDQKLESALGGTAAGDIQVTKAVSPAAVLAGEVVTYTVTFLNQGSAVEVIDAITDTLPTGFALLALAPSSNVTQTPTVTANTLSWTGPFSIPISGTLNLVYQVRTALVAGVETPTNQVIAFADSLSIGPASAVVTLQKHSVFLPLIPMDYEPARFTAAKSASPAEVKLEETVDFTVRLRNEGDLPGVINTIVDTLPAGFTFVGMLPGSGVSTPPAGTTGTIVWTGPFPLAAKAELVVMFRTRAPNTPGQYVNQATVTTLTGAAPRQPGTATVNVKSPILLTSDFESGTPGWQPFLNYWRLNEEQWYWDPGYGYDGSNGYTNFGLAGIDPTKKKRGAEDSLTMYMGPGSAGWTDYRLKARFNWIGGGFVGVWFRGTYQDSETPAQWVTGYYFVIRVRPNNLVDAAQLQQLRTLEERFGEDNDAALYAWNNPADLLPQRVPLNTRIEPGQWHQITVEARGNNFKCWVDDELAIDFTDTEGSVFMQGTVGLYTFGWPETNAALVQFDDVIVEPLD